MKSRVLLISIGIGILAGGALYSKKITVLCLENRDRPGAYQTWVGASERFSISYVHSIYQEPVTEEFQLRQGMIVLNGVRAIHPGVLEYYGFGDTSEYHPMDRRFRSLLFRVATGEPQRLRVRDKRVSFIEIGERGDQIQLSIRSMPLGRYLFHHVFPQ